MKTATLLIVVLSNAGYWFGGREATVGVRYTAEDALPAADLTWELHLAGARLSSGKLALEPGDADDEAAAVNLTPPTVRVRSAMRWTYRLTERDTGKTLERGEVTLHVFPDDLLQGVGGRVAGKRLIVVGGDDDLGLSELLRAAEVPHSTIARPSDLALARPDIVLVGRDALDESPFQLSPLLAHAGAGASVVVFRQSKVSRIVAYPLAPMRVPAAIKWRARHPLLAAFGEEQLDDLLRDGAEARAVRLPPDEAALEVVWSPREVNSREPAPLDALVVTKSVGRGRLVICQLPLAGWEADPRAQMLLAGALDYAVTPPQPTPPPSRRREPAPVAPAPVPTIGIPPGGQP